MKVKVYLIVSNMSHAWAYKSVIGGFKCLTCYPSVARSFNLYKPLSSPSSLMHPHTSHRELESLNRGGEGSGGKGEGLWKDCTSGRGIMAPFTPPSPSTSTDSLSPM